MAVYVAAVHMSGGTDHQHIASFVWVLESTYKSGISTLSSMVDYVDGGNEVRVSDGSTTVKAVVVRDTGKAPYLRTFADGKLSDNLLSLPRY
jgi:hypothetical protein